MSIYFCFVLGVYQESLPDVKKSRGDVPDILPTSEVEPTNAASDFETSYNYVCESAYQLF